MRLLWVFLFFWISVTGHSNPYLKPFKTYRKDSYFKEKVYSEKSIDSFFQLIEIQQMVDPDSLDIHLLNACVFFATNKLRAMHHVPPLQFSSRLQEAAALHSYQMVLHHFFEHENSYVKKLEAPEDRMRYTGAKFSASAENIAEQPLDGDISYIGLAEAIVEGWYNSAGHRVNLLNRQYRYMGAAVAIQQDKDGGSVLVTQDFCD